MSNPNALTLFAKNRVRHEVEPGTDIVIRKDTGRVTLTDLIDRRNQDQASWALEWGVEGLSDAELSRQCDRANIEYYVPPPTPDVGLFLWYDAGYGVITGSGNPVPVLYWRDKANPTNNSHTLTASGGSPYYVSSCYDYNQQAVVTSGAFVSPMFSLSASGDLTYYVVGNQGTAVYGWGPGLAYVSAPFIANTGDPNTGPSLRIVYNYFDNGMHVQMYPDFNFEPGIFSYGLAWRKHIHYLYHASVTGSNYSVDSLSVTASLVPTSSRPLRRFQLAYDGQGNGSAKFAEIRVYKGKHSAEERGTILNYLATKYGVILAGSAT